MQIEDALALAINDAIHSRVNTVPAVMIADTLDKSRIKATCILYNATSNDHVK